MLPHSVQEDGAPLPRTIYINPNFNQVRLTRTSNDVVAATVTSSHNGVTTTRAPAHFNPLFLNAQRPPAIHMNPQFLKQKLLEQQQRQFQRLQLENVTALPQQPSIPHPALTPKNSTFTTAPSLAKASERKIIAKTRTCIVREPAIKPTGAEIVTKPAIQRTVLTPAPIIKLSKRKLVRATATASAIPIKANPTITTATTAMGKYKIDRRLLTVNGGAISKTALALAKAKRRSFVARYALRRSTSETNGVKRKTSTSIADNPRFKFHPSAGSKNLQLLNINGVLYRSTRNKLQRKDAQTPAISNTTERSKSKTLPTANASTTSKRLAQARTLFVRGTKFVMDKQGFKLTRVPANGLTASPQTTGGPAKRQRIDIGGLTYVASQTQNVFVRTRNHLTLAHLNNAKQRSLQLLAKRFVKSNVPCAIFQRLGKCLAYERGRCNKVHDKRQVIICPKFLRSECHDSNCLLSHNVSLSKMPVCKFFLQGVCVRPDCPYLHKKLSSNADVCEDFLRGFCKLAEQCNKRHEFLCPEIARKGKCELTSCTYCKTRKRRLSPKEVKKTEEKSKISENTIQPMETNDLPVRYFSGKAERESAANTQRKYKEEMETDEQNVNDVNDDDDADEAILPATMRLSRPKVGVLPAFIPLS